MAEIGLVPFAPLAPEVASAAVPRYRSQFSKRQFTQPQLLAILCLMRYEDWTIRVAEVRLAEHRELRRVQGLSSVPDHTTLYRYLNRLGDGPIQQALGTTVRRQFPRRLYRRRALVEGVFSAVKRKLSARAPVRTLTMQMRHVLLLGLTYNIERLALAPEKTEDVNRSRKLVN